MLFARWTPGMADPRNGGPLPQQIGAVHFTVKNNQSTLKHLHYNIVILGPIVHVHIERRRSVCKMGIPPVPPVPFHSLASPLPSLPETESQK